MKTDRQSVESLIAWKCSKDTPDVAEILLALLAEKEAAEQTNATAAVMLQERDDNLAAAEAERDASQVDAERYRYMRDNATFANQNGPQLRWLLPRWGDDNKLVRLDQAIDVARKETRK